MSAALRVAVIGASGIGKNHARWFNGHGCHICAFVGSSPESLDHTNRTLVREFGFTGQAYQSVPAMLDAEKPDAVCISCPPQLHYQYAMLCLEAGAHVLCEKPLVHDPELSTDELLKQASQLVQAASERSLTLAAQTQYSVLAPMLLELCGCSIAEEVRSFEMEMETRNLKPGRDHEAIWMDLAPHPLSVLLKLTGDGELLPESVDAVVASRASQAHFQVRRPDGSHIESAVRVSYNPDPGAPNRRFTLNGRSVSVAGRNDAEGRYHLFLQPEGRPEIEIRDLVDTLIGQFVGSCQGTGVPVVSGAEAARNLEWQLRILDAARREN